jgi:two-component system phosphate regulon sensor histidine kinase PhoR
MSKSKFIGLICMMLISLAGIIFVQIKWIKKSVGINNEIFNNTVYFALADVAQTLESNRQTAFLNSYNASVNQKNQLNNNSVSGYLSINHFSSEAGTGFEININSFLQPPYSGSGVNMNQTNINIRQSGLTGDTAIVPDTYPELFGTRTNHGAQEFNSGISGKSLNAEEFTTLVQNRLNELQIQGGKMIAELLNWEKNIVIDKNEVRYWLKQRLSYSGINTPFEFAIIKDGKISDGYFKQAKEAEFNKSLYKTPLFSDGIYKQDVVLSVVFPQKSDYVLGSMVWILGGSLLFSLIILATFGVSLYFIIHQKKVSEMKSDFINNMTHEFKTPIATISLAADTITNSKVINDETGIRHFIALIKKENSRMNKQVETILQIASLDKKEMDFEFEEVSIHALIERAVETIEIQVLQKEGQIHLNLQAENCMILGDQEHLTNLFHNLLDNANKYSPDKPDISVSTINKPNGIQVSVEDKGIGMSKAIQSKIFEKFYRQSSGNIHNVKGFGLGLSYAKAIIEAHKGSINVISELGEGARFDIFLPFKAD